MRKTASFCRLPSLLCRSAPAVSSQTATPVLSALSDKFVHFGSSHPSGLQTQSCRGHQRLNRYAVGAGALLSGYLLWRQRAMWLPIVSASTVPPPSTRFNFIADAVEKTAPAVVYIEILGRHPFTQQQIAVSNGSGFVVRPDGLILTNAHVVADGRLVTVKLHDGRQFTGKVEAVDRRSDLATVRIPAKGLPTLQLTHTDQLRPGEWVVAMGSPLALNNTITAGVVSSVHRSSKELGIHNEMDYIQTDAAINFGNSGGPLINLDGNVIGINTMKVTAGISFAIPADYAMNFLEEASKKNQEETSAERWYLGITMLTLTPSLILELQQRDPMFPHVTNGVLVWRVMLGSPANLPSPMMLQGMEHRQHLHMMRSLPSSFSCSLNHHHHHHNHHHHQRGRSPAW
ncbi:serine protease HTRA2, mitochondrial isoform X2 [Dermacentor andersoni]|uniref:serine protease HTRA2, mitochondrial isoform X2 n=1 Tax=Dermacentor andersoni TaxID=34620 RepID=UPI002416A700|nr:serine protease HTRA2, mitochondrial-like isoform X2 [Dermacentor andersoni]